MKKIVSLSLVAATTMAFGSTSSDLAAMKAEIAALKSEVANLKKSGSAAEVKKLNKKINEVKAHDAGDNIKWGADVRTAIDSINYDMADGSERSKNDLMSLRLWLNMEYAPDNQNIFKGQLSMNKAFGADFAGNSGYYPRGWGMDSFDWVTNEALAGDDLKVRQAYWLYLGEKAFGLDMPWTFSVGRRPSTNGFLANLRDDDPEQSPLGHIINVEFDGLSSKLDLSNVTGVTGMSFKLCMGQGSTNAAPMFSRLDSTQYSNEDDVLNDIKLAGFIFEPYNDGQYIVKTTAFRAYDLPGYDPMAMGAAMDGDPTTNPSMRQVGDMAGAALSVLVDGLGDEGILAETKVFGSFAWSKTLPNAGEYMLGMPLMDMTDPMNPVYLGDEGAHAGESKTGTSYWIGTQIPVISDGVLGLEYNHGSRYWRPFDYAEDTMIGSKLAARGDAFEAYFTYQLTEALSAQLRYTYIDYDYTGSNNFFAADGTPIKIADIKAGYWGEDMAAMTVDKAQDARFYIRYRF
ncbi:MAG: DUF3373 family protein [Campylobacterales bacterium]|nr:DUF3373 family protein [Campylobacterales bacterium]